MVPPRFLDCGEAMLVVEFGDRVDASINARVLALDAALANAAIDGVVELVPTFRSLAVHYEPLILDRADLIARIEALAPGVVLPAPPSASWRLPVCHEGPHGEDLAEAATRLGLSPARLVELHASVTHRIAMYGFSPGFAYLAGLPGALALSRRERPRPPHPMGAIMIAGGLSAIAGVPMPTGWWVIGRTPERLFSPARDPALVMAVGDRIHFEPVDATTFAALEARVATGEIVARRGSAT